MEKVAGCVIAAIVWAALYFLLALVLMLLWNGLVPDVFHGPSLSYWQAFIAILLLGFVAGFFRSTRKEE